MKTILTNFPTLTHLVLTDSTDKVIALIACPSGIKQDITLQVKEALMDDIPCEDNSFITILTDVRITDWGAVTEFKARIKDDEDDDDPTDYEYYLHDVKTY